MSWLLPHPLLGKTLRPWGTQGKGSLGESPANYGSLRAWRIKFGGAS
jgi:hypothetical protein